MDLIKGSTPTVVFLLVDTDSFQTGKTGLTPTVNLSKNGGPFAKTSQQAKEIGSGWYSVALSAAETDTLGPLILQASAAGATIWRDVHVVVDGTPKNGTGGGTVVVAPPAGVNAARNGDFAQGKTFWNLYSNGKADWDVKSGVAELSVDRLGNNTQLYQYGIAVQSGEYDVQFDAKASDSRKLEVFLHQHDLPRLSLGLSGVFNVGAGWNTYQKSFTVPQAEGNARLRFWLVTDFQTGDTLSIRNVSLIKK